jgi:hypothetical protein
MRDCWISPTGSTDCQSIVSHLALTDQIGDYEKPLDFTRRLKLQLIINELFVTLRWPIRVATTRIFTDYEL